MIHPAHYKALFKLGIPIVIGQLGMIVLGFADTLMIGHHSTEDLAAASFVNNMFNLVIIFATELFSDADEDRASNEGGLI